MQHTKPDPIHTRYLRYMPFIQRNKAGEIAGLFGLRQFEGQEELSEDHPEVLKFNELHHVPPEMTRRMTPDELERYRQDNKEQDIEIEKLHKLVLIHSNVFSILENALGNLMKTILNIEPKSSHLAHGVYFTPSGFEQRLQLIDNVLLIFIDENNKNNRLQKFLDLWKILIEALRSAKDLRKVVAHGSVQRFIFNGKTHVRLASPAFDVIRVWKKFSKKQIPDIDSHNLSIGLRKLGKLELCVDDVIRIVVATREDDDSTLQQIFSEAELRLMALNTQ